MITKIHSSKHDIVTNGIRFLLALYGDPKQIDSIEKYRYLRFVKTTWNNKIVQFSCLLPISASTFHHLYHVYYQVQIGLVNDLRDNFLEPIQILLPPLPEKLLNILFCACKTGCRKNCGCQKVGLFCSPVCISCHDQSCCNTELNTTDDNSYVIKEETTDPSLFLEHPTEIQQEKKKKVKKNK